MPTVPTIINRLTHAFASMGSAPTGSPSSVDTPSPSPDIPLNDGSGTRVEKTDQAIAGGEYGMASTTGTIRLSRINSEAQRRLGDGLWDAIDSDPRAGGSVDTLIYTAIPNNLQVHAAYQPDPGSDPNSITPEQRIDHENSKMAAEWVAANFDGLRTPIHETLRSFVRAACVYGSSLADLVWVLDDVADSPFPQLRLDAIKCKSRRVWFFEVNPFMDVEFVGGTSGFGGTLGRWPREKFALMTWGGRDSDPRGKSIYSRAVEAFNFRAQLPEDHYRFLKRFAIPKVVGKLSQRSMTQTTETRNRNPFQRFYDQVERWINGSHMVVGADDVVEVYEVKGEGQAYEQAWEMYGREIVLAVLLQTRATMEAKHGSKADSGTGQDILGNLVRFLRRLATQNLETDVAYKIVAYRWGDEFARRYTPTLSLGETEHQDLNAVLQGLSFCGYTFDATQLAEIDKFLGFVTPRNPDVVTQEGGDVVEPSEDDPAKTTTTPGVGPNKMFHRAHGPRGRHGRSVTVG